MCILFLNTVTMYTVSIHLDTVYSVTKFCTEYRHCMQMLCIEPIVLTLCTDIMNWQYMCSNFLCIYSMCILFLILCQCIQCLHTKTNCLSILCQYIYIYIYMCVCECVYIYIYMHIIYRHSIHRYYFQRSVMRLLTSILSYHLSCDIC